MGTKVAPRGRQAEAGARPEAALQALDPATHPERPLPAERQPLEEAALALAARARRWAVRAPAVAWRVPGAARVPVAWRVSGAARGLAVARAPGARGLAAARAPIATASWGKRW